LKVPPKQTNKQPHTHSATGHRLHFLLPSAYKLHFKASSHGVWEDGKNNVSLSVNEVSNDGPRQQSGCLFIAAKRRHKKLPFVVSHYLRVVLVVFALFLTFLYRYSSTLERGMNLIMFIMQILVSKSPVPTLNYV